MDYLNFFANVDERLVEACIHKVAVAERIKSENFCVIPGNEQKEFCHIPHSDFFTCIDWFSSIKSVIHEPFRSGLDVNKTQLSFLLGLIPILPYWLLILAFATFGFFGDAISCPQSACWESARTSSAINSSCTSAEEMTVRTMLLTT